MIFISYSTKNEQIAEKINDILEKSNFKTWFAKKSIKIGENYASSIVKAIEHCSCVVLLFSEDANSSEHVQKELELALNKSKKIYPVRVEDFLPTKAFEYHFSTMQYIDIFENIDKDISKLIDALNDIYDLRIDKKIDVENLSKKHFKNMDYEIIDTNKEYWESRAELSFYKKDNPNYIKIVSYLNSKCFLAKKENIEMIVCPIYKDEIKKVSNLKTIESDIFWEARFVIWTEASIKNVLNSLNVDEKLLEEDDIDYKLKSKIVDNFRDFNIKKRLNILFYLYINDSCKYEELSYSLPLKGKYSKSEQMSNLFINYSFAPIWWAYKKDDIENITVKTYFGFNSAFEKALK